VYVHGERTRVRDGIFTPRAGSASDRRQGADPLAFREGAGRWLDAGSARDLQELIDACHDDLRLATGDEPGADDARAMLGSCPADVTPAQRLTLGVYDGDGALAAAVDAYRDFPHAVAWTLAVLLVRPDLRGRGLATGVLSRLERVATDHGGTAVHVVAPARNRAMLQLLRRAGYEQRRELALPVRGRSLRGYHLVRELDAERPAVG
jgi:GNAT superfamily N-acetyltransferase